jgi:hypothetical protein
MADWGEHPELKGGNASLKSGDSLNRDIVYRNISGQKDNGKDIS